MARKKSETAIAEETVVVNEEPKATPKPKTAKVNVNLLNFRDKASTEGTVINQISEGEEVEILSNSKGWSKVLFKGITGFVMTEYLTIQ